jgi:exonuclease III
LKSHGNNTSNNEYKKYSEHISLKQKITKPTTEKRIHRQTKVNITKLTLSIYIFESGRKHIKIKPLMNKHLQIKTTTSQYNAIKRMITLLNDVETNPGPQFDLLETKNNHNLIIMSYNLQGCRDYRKLKRITNFIHRQKFKDNCIINLQETHFNERGSLNYHWSKGSIQSTTTNNSGGVAILYNSTNFDQILETKEDNNGRMCSFTAVKNDNVVTYINIYAPNNHYESIDFFKEVENYLNGILTRHPTSIITISGDFNFIFDKDVDSIGRQYRLQEQNLSTHVKKMMTRLNLVDTYRSIHKWGGFTWGRDNPNYIRSRIDHILISKTKVNDIVQSYTNRSPNESDHSMLYTEINSSELKYCPGIQRCNSNLLENEETLTKVIKTLTEHIDGLSEKLEPTSKARLH